MLAEADDRTFLGALALRLRMVAALAARRQPLDIACGLGRARAPFPVRPVRLRPPLVFMRGLAPVPVFAVRLRRPLGAAMRAFAARLVAGAAAASATPSVLAAELGGRKPLDRHPLDGLADEPFDRGDKTRI